MTKEQITIDVLVRQRNEQANLAAKYQSDSLSAQNEVTKLRREVDSLRGELDALREKDQPEVIDITKEEPDGSHKE